VGSGEWNARERTQRREHTQAPCSPQGSLSLCIWLSFWIVSPTKTPFDPAASEIPSPSGPHVLTKQPGLPHTLTPPLLFVGCQRAMQQLLNNLAHLPLVDTILWGAFWAASLPLCTAVCLLALPFYFIHDFRFGRELALSLAAQGGMVVYAGCLSAESAEQLEQEVARLKLKAGRLIGLKLDVTKQEDIDTCRKKLYALVNNGETQPRRRDGGPRLPAEAKRGRSYACAAAWRQQDGTGRLAGH
jgi:hypothetical protein